MLAIIRTKYSNLSVIPANRNYKICVKDLGIEFEIYGASVNEEHIKTIENAKRLKKEDPREALIRILSRWQETTKKKQLTWIPFENAQDEKDILSALKKSILPNEVKSCIEEAMKQK